MCDQHHLRTLGSTVFMNVEHVNRLSEQLAELYLNSELSDITFKVEDTQFQAHKIIMAARSEYFRAMLYGGMRESQPGTTVIELQGTSAMAFSSILKYIYTGKMNLAEIKDENLLDILGLAHQYGFADLESAISDYLKSVLNIANVCLIYDLANMYNLQSLIHTCTEFIDQNAWDVLHSPAFLSLSMSSVKELICRDSFCANEIDIFDAIREWAESNTDRDPTVILESLRLSLMTIPDLLGRVRESGLVCSDAILDAISVKFESKDVDLRYRGFLLPWENVATPRHNAEVVTGEMKTALLDGDSASYDLDRGFTRHSIDDDDGQGICIKLGKPYIINSINMLLWDKDFRSYSYIIEVSMNDKEYMKVIDYSTYLCRSWQKLRFSPRVARYIRVRGVHNTVNRVFHLVSFECSHSSEPCDLFTGIIVPRENVALQEASACVVEGVTRSRNALISGETKHYTWDSGYTCHQLGSGCIKIQLAQPYIINHIKMLLWDCDDRRYSYYIEVSSNGRKWHMVADKRHEDCFAWQMLSFPPLPVTFIKIVGTHNTANEVFHVVHFSCWAEDIPSIQSSTVETIIPDALTLSNLQPPITTRDISMTLVDGGTQVNPEASASGSTTLLNPQTLLNLSMAELNKQ